MISSLAERSGVSEELNRQEQQELKWEIFWKETLRDLKNQEKNTNYIHIQTEQQTEGKKKQTNKPNLKDPSRSE